MEKAEGTAGGRRVGVKYPGVWGGTISCLGLERLNCEKVVVEAEPRGAMQEQPVCLRSDCALF